MSRSTGVYAFTSPAADATPAEIETLTMRIIAEVGEFLATHPDLITDTPDDDQATAIILDAMKAGLNPAQIQVRDEVMGHLM